jgi:DNA-binding response OmpR family regulator
MRVLVVDDEHLIADTLALILNLKGFEARVAYSGEEAIETARTMEPHLVLSDVMMKEMTGVEASMEIARLFPRCQIVLFSGQASTLDVLEKARKNGHDWDVWQKPLHPSTLVERLNRIRAKLVDEGAFPR